MNSSRNFKYALAIVLMLLLNAYLIFQNHGKNRMISNLSKDIRLYSESISGDSAINSSVQFLPIEFQDPLNLVLVYPKEYCGSCIDMDLPILQEIAERYPSIMYVVGNGINYNMVSMIDSNSERVSLLDLTDKGFPDEFLRVDLPKIYLVDSGGQIILKYRSIFGDIDSHKVFFERVLSLLSITYVN